MKHEEWIELYKSYGFNSIFDANYQNMTIEEGRQFLEELRDFADEILGNRKEQQCLKKQKS